MVLNASLRTDAEGKVLIADGGGEAACISGWPVIVDEGVSW